MNDIGNEVLEMLKAGDKRVVNVDILNQALSNKKFSILTGKDLYKC